MKAEFDAGNKWLVRSVTDTRVAYYCARRIWDASPIHATLFPDKNSAEHALYDLEHSSARIVLDGEEYAVVTLEAALRPFLKV